jgi:hypothetical protein
MKFNKKFILIPLLTLALPIAAMATSQNSTQPKIQKKDQTTHGNTETPQGDVVRNQNEVKTQNQGEAQMLQVTTAEKEQHGQETTETTGKKGNNAEEKSDMAKSKMSEVAKKVQELKETYETWGGGIGKEISEFAKQHNEGQKNARENVNKLDKQPKFLKFFMGADKNALNELKNLMQQNQVRVKQLEKLKVKFANQADQDKIQQTINAMVTENTALQEKIQVEEDIPTLMEILRNFVLSN